MSKRIFLEDEKVILRLLEKEDLEGEYITWFDDDEVCSGNNHHRFPYSQSDMLNYIEQSNKNQSSLVLAIVKKSNKKHIGNIAISRIDYINSSADYSIVIGDKESWNGGYGYSASRLMINHVFQQLNLNRISIGTFSTNSSMQKLALKLGAIEEGRRREAIFKNGVYVDIIEYGLLKREFKELK